MDEKMEEPVGDSDTSSTMDEKIGHLCAIVEKRRSWTIDIVRRHFILTAIEQLEDGMLEDWEGRFRVNFIGEEGVDAGGLKREFFSLLFEKTKYKLLGKATALSILYGHPGPQCFNKYVAEYIVSGIEPEEVNPQSIEREDVSSVVIEVSCM